MPGPAATVEIIAILDKAKATPIVKKLFLIKADKI
jgi:hypothetical protein